MAKSKKKPPNRIPVLVRRDYRRGLRFVGVLAALSAFCGLCFLASGRFSRALAESDDNVIGARDIKITSKPEWLTVDLLPRALADAGIDAERIPLGHGDLVARIGRALEASPWVRRVEVRKAHLELVVTIEYRRPVVCVPVGTGEKCCYLDADGSVLPFAEASQDSLGACLVAEGLTIEPLPEAGRPVRDDRARAAAQLANLLLEAKDALDLLVIVMGKETPAGVSCELRTRRGTRIRWGLVQPEGEASSPRKLDPLYLHKERHGNLEQPRGPYFFDLTDPDAKPTRLAEIGGNETPSTSSPLVHD